MEAYIEMDDGQALWTHLSGSGPPVVLLNGGPGMADYLEPLANLIDGQFTVYRYEPRGCGRSPAPGPFTLAQSITDLEALRSHWRHDSWHVIGHSWGVDLGLAYAIKYPLAMTRLVGISGGRIHNDREWHKIYKRGRRKERMPPAFTEPNLSVNDALNADWRAYCKRVTLLSELATLDVPTSFIYGAEDIRPQWPTEQLAALIPSATFTLVPGADHHIWQGNPKALQAAILAVLEP